MPKVIPEGYHSVTTSFTFKDSQKAIATHKQDLNQAEICKGAEAFFAQMAKK